MAKSDRFSSLQSKKPRVCIRIYIHYPVPPSGPRPVPLKLYPPGRFLLQVVFLEQF